MSKKYQIIFTGGGSGGHVMPTVTLLQDIKDHYAIGYIGGSGIEKELIGSIDIPFHSITTGKLRRYISIENIIDMFKVVKGIIDSIFILLKKSNKGTLIFSTGGFVTVPVVLAAWLLGRRIFVHEQTTQVGLANKIASKFATKVFVSFEDSQHFFPKKITKVSGYPLREDLFNSQKQPIEYEGITINENTKPLLFITGGGNGSKLVNDLIAKNLKELSDRYYIVHQVGKGFINEFKKFKSSKYHPVDFVGSEMINLYKWADIIISRAGAGTVCELIALKKRSIFIPLKMAQKNEQFHNAKEAEKKIGSLVIEEDEIEKLDLLTTLNEFKSDERDLSYTKTLNGKDILIEEIREALN